MLEEVLVKEGLTVTCQTLMADLKSMEMQGVIRETRTTFGDMASMDPQVSDYLSTGFAGVLALTCWHRAHVRVAWPWQ